MSDKNEIPFDLSHSRVLKYKDIGDILDEKEAKDIRELLSSYIRGTNDQGVDSPMYTYLSDITPPVIGEKEYNALIDSIKDETENVYARRSGGSSHPKSRRNGWFY